MCGILGSINISEASDLLRYIEHRGPDAMGNMDFEINAHTVQLLHARLSILDLSEAGGQPMLSGDGRGCIVFNGEIYNHEELKKEFNGIEFIGHSDTETIINYFREKPILENLKNLNGIFAFAYLDFDKKLLYLARDRFGVKPLYYYCKGNDLMFSSEIRPLKAYLNPTIDAGVVVNSLRMRYTPAPMTIYAGIAKVEPGQMVIFDLADRDISCTKQYFIKKGPAGSYQGEWQQMVREYGNLFEKAVERQLMADVDIGILLSGGVDSALVAAVAQSKSPKRITGFTIGFDGDCHEEDETEYARQTAEVLRLEHCTRKIGFSDFLDSIHKTVNIVEEPIGTTSIIPMNFLAELAASQVKVVLSGQGADEPLGGYYKYKGLLVLERANSFKGLASLLDKMNLLYKGNENSRRLFSALLAQDKIDSIMELNAICSTGDIGKMLNPSHSHKHTAALQKKQELLKNIWNKCMPIEMDLENLGLYMDLRTSLADDLLMYTDKLTMHYGLECRVPILDNDLIAFIESLDRGYKYDFRKGKIIHKAFAREYLPTCIVERKKLSFKSPTEAWFRENEGEIVQVFSENQEFLHLFKLEEIKLLIKRHRNGANLEKQIFLLLSLNFLLSSSRVADYSKAYQELP